MSDPNASCPKCGALLTESGCAVCGFEWTEQSLADRDMVSPGRKVYITYYDLHHVPAIVRSVINRRMGDLSVRILQEDMPAGHTYGTDPTDGMIPLVVVAGEWELSK